MLIKDYITAQQRMDFSSHNLVDYADHYCSGCDRTSNELAVNDGWTDDDFDNNSRTTVEGNWYCHIDCFRDSRG